MRARAVAATAAVLVMLAATFVPAEDKGKQGGDADADKKALQGTWQTVTSEMDGEKTPEDEVKEYQVVFAGDKLSILKSGDVFMAGTFTVDTGPKPRHIDLKLEKNEPNPDDVGKTLRGIYEAEGDTLKWCFALSADAERPKAFATTSGSQSVNAALKREKEKKE
jgi:uncharacterized protein (TIGR03067 family)